MNFNALYNFGYNAGYNRVSALSADFPAPEISSIDVDADFPTGIVGGTMAGGTPFTLYGSNFLSGATITIGGAAATSVVFVNSGELTGVSPAGTHGWKDVVVTNPAGDDPSDTLVNGWVYGLFKLPGTAGDLDSDYEVGFKGDLAMANEVAEGNVYQDGTIYALKLPGTETDNVNIAIKTTVLPITDCVVELDVYAEAATGSFPRTIGPGVRMAAAEAYNNLTFPNINHNEQDHELFKRVAGVTTLLDEYTTMGTTAGNVYRHYLKIVGQNIEAEVYEVSAGVRGAKIGDTLTASLGGGELTTGKVGLQHGAAAFTSADVWAKRHIIWPAPVS